ncbi:MAG: Zn-ribbon domain-containing OB-fold protein [Dehalococcoidia bacterium]
MTEKIKEYPGTSLRDADIREGRVLTTEWHPNLKYAWDAGVAVGRFLAELKEGRIIGTRCEKCHRIVVPPRVFCELCFKPSAGFLYLKDTGTVNTFSIAYTDWAAARIEEPRFPAVIEIDGASKGIGIMHVLGEVAPDKIKIGMRVKAVWKPRRAREGAITDIKYFKPL